jgi:hypothetical protein
VKREETSPTFCALDSPGLLPEAFSITRYALGRVALPGAAACELQTNERALMPPE